MREQANQREASHGPGVVTTPAVGSGRASTKTIGAVEGYTTSTALQSRGKKCKHDNESLVFMVGTQRNGSTILWCAVCGACKFGKNVGGMFGGRSKWWKPKR